MDQGRGRGGGCQREVQFRMKILLEMRLQNSIESVSAYAAKEHE
jgi:hypothetical protein